MRGEPDDVPSAPSVETREPDGGRASGPRSGPRSDDSDELLSAYVDGITELAPEDRRRVEAHLARDPAAPAEEASLRALVGRLRALPPEGEEPDWAAMERSIRDAVGPDVPRPWWRAWRWLVPLPACAVAAAVLIVAASSPDPVPGAASVPPPRVALPSDRAGEPAHTGDDDPAVVALWLDGAGIEVDLSASEMLRGAEIGDDEAPPDADVDPDAGPGLLLATSLAWVDRLDEDALARAERWLASSGPPNSEQRGGGGTVPGPAGLGPRKKS